MDRHRAPPARPADAGARDRAADRGAGPTFRARCSRGSSARRSAWSRWASRPRWCAAPRSSRCSASSSPRTASISARCPRRGGLPTFVELGLVFDLVLIVSVAGGVQREDPRGARHRRHHRCSEACVTDALAIAVPALPVVVRPADPARPHPAGGGPHQHRGRTRDRGGGADPCGRRVDAQRDADPRVVVPAGRRDRRVSRRRRGDRAVERAGLTRPPRRPRTRPVSRDDARAPGTTSASTCSGRRCSRCR